MSAGAKFTTDNDPATSRTSDRQPMGSFMTHKIPQIRTVNCKHSLRKTSDAATTPRHTPQSLIVRCELSPFVGHTCFGNSLFPVSKANDHRQHFGAFLFENPEQYENCDAEADSKSPPDVLD